jgi:hypothetical protein
MAHIRESDIIKANERINNNYQLLHDEEELRYPVTNQQVPNINNEENATYEIVMPESFKVGLILISICCFTLFIIILLLK